MSSDSISPSNLPPLSSSARLSASTSKMRGSRPSAICFGRSTISPMPTMTGMWSSERGEVGLVIVFCFHFLNTGRPRPEERPLGRVSKDEAVNSLMVRDGAPDSARALPGARLLTMRISLLRHQRVQMLYCLDKIFLEFLHHGAGGFHAVDQADALSDEVADEVARLRVTGGRGAIDGVERVAADDALQRHRQRAGAVGPAVPRIGPDRTQLAGRLSGAAPGADGVARGGRDHFFAEDFGGLGFD